MVTIPYLWLSLPVFSVPVLFQLPLSISHAFQNAGVTVLHRGTGMLLCLCVPLIIDSYAVFLSVSEHFAKTTVKPRGLAQA